MHKPKFSLTLLVSLIGCTSAFAIENQTQVITKEATSIASTYWTAERLQNAKPLTPEVRPEAIKETSNPLANGEGEGDDGAPPEADFLPKPELLFNFNESKNTDNVVPFDHGTANEYFSSSRLIPVTADVSYPYRTVGKLFFTIPNRGDFVCSASVLRHRVVLTAGHCVHSGSGGNNGFYNNFLFVPAFRDGAAPYQTWNWSYAAVTATWASGGGSVPNAADYAMLEMQDKPFNDALRRIGTVTGYLGYQTLALTPNHAHLLGYPCNLDSCQKMHQVTAQSARSVSPNNVEYGSDMGGGASGGPWVQNFGALATGQTGGQNPGFNRVIGVTSYGYISKDPLALGASNPDGRFTSLLNTVCAHRTGNCA